MVNATGSPTGFHNGSSTLSFFYISGVAEVVPKGGNVVMYADDATVFTHHHHYHHLFAQNTIKVDSGYVNEQTERHTVL